MSSTKIMVVDDDDRIRFAFQQLLEKENYNCIEARSGTDAVMKFDLEHPQIVFLDILLPDINGLNVLRRIKEIDESVSVIIISGQMTFQDEMKAMNFGAFESLSKPFSVSKIREVLCEVRLSREKLSVHSRPDNGPTFSESKEKILNKFEKRFVKQQLLSHNGNITAAAKASQMSRQNFYRLLVKHNIELERFR